MKKKLTFLFAFIFIGSTAFAQLTFDGDFLHKYRSVFIGFGPRSLNTDPGTMVTSFIDESQFYFHRWNKSTSLLFAHIKA